MRDLLPLILILALIMPLAVQATDIPDPALSSAEMPAGSFPRFLMVVPDGSGPPLGEARLDDGSVLSAVITVTLINGNGDPIQAYPYEDLWVENECGDIALCHLGSNADGPTDVHGQTTISGPFAAGGHSTPGCDMVVLVANTPVVGPGFDLRLNSPDITGDLDVNLSDITLFTQAIASYDWAADLTSDGVINLSDITLMAQGIGAGCP